MKTLIITAVTAILLSCQCATAQSLQAYAYSAEGKTYYQIFNAVPHSVAAFYSERWGGKQLYNQPISDDGMSLLRTDTHFPAFVINRENRATNIKGNNKVVYFDRKEFTIEHIKLSVKDGQRHIQWQAAVAEKAAYVFEILASKDGIGFYPLYTLVPHSTHLSSYDYDISDSDALYFQVKVTGVNNQLNYLSGLLNINAGRITLIYPTLVRNEVHIQLASKSNESSYWIQNMQGQTVRNGYLPEAGNDIALTELAQGLYLVEVNDGGTITTQKIIKE